MKIILFIILVIVGCKRELSCEGCIINPPTDTIYNDLITGFNIYIDDPSTVRAIYPQLQTKLHPGHYYIFETVRIDTSRHYESVYDLKNYLNMGDFYKGDSFYVKYEIRNRVPPSTFFQFDTLIY